MRRICPIDSFLHRLGKYFALFGCLLCPGIKYAFFEFFKVLGFHRVPITVRRLVLIHRT